MSIKPTILHLCCHRKLSKVVHTSISLINFLQLFWEDPKAFAGKIRYIIFPGCFGSTACPPAGHSKITFIKMIPGCIRMSKMPNWPQLTPLSVKDQQIYSEFLMDVWTAHPQSKPPCEENLSRKLISWSNSLGGYPRLTTTGEGWNEDRSVNQNLCLQAQLPLHKDSMRKHLHYWWCIINAPVDPYLTHTSVQDYKILEPLTGISVSKLWALKRGMDSFPAEYHCLRLLILR